ncbi:MAG: Rho termination factor N-terminal domain-containing protein [Cyanobacteria bacterium J06582_2]
MTESGYSTDANDSDEPTKQELYQQAQDLNINGRSKMNKAELHEAVKGNVSNNLQEQTRDELYEQAQDLDIDGRSRMNKEELAQAIQKEKS